MNHMTWMRSILLCASGLGFFAFPKLSHACGWGDLEVEDQTFFDPGVILRPLETPFFFTAHKLNGSPVYDTSSDFRQVNLDEWIDFLEKKIPAEAWSKLLYQAPLERIDNLIFALQGKPKAALDPNDQPFLSYPDRPRLIAALFYVGFAKRVEPIAMERAAQNSWSPSAKPVDAKARDQIIALLIEGGSKALANAKLPFLHRRYLFQILRLHFYRKDPSQTVKFYQEHLKELDGPDGIGWRAMGYAAGALRQENRRTEANRLYARLFDQSPPAKVAALLSFRLQEDADWNQLLSQAQSIREKTVLWQMLGITADGPRAIQEILALDRRSELLPLLVVREVNRAEVEAYNASDADKNRWQDKQKPLLSLLDSALRAGDLANQPVWHLAVGHLHALHGQTDAALRYLDRAASLASKEPLLLRQLRVSRLFATLQGMTLIKQSDEPMLLRELTWLQQLSKQESYPSRVFSFFGWAKHRLASLYRQQGLSPLALCLQDTDDPLYQDPLQIDRLIQFLRKSNKSGFEQFLASNYQVPEHALIEQKALLALYGGDIPKAAALYKPLNAGALNADPFAIHLRDCHECDANDPKHKTYTKTEFVLRLAELLLQAKANPKQASSAYFEIANGLYNISWFGNSRYMYMTEGSHFSRALQINDNKNALAYYQKAYELSTDREFRAKASFMIAKCEQNAFFATPNRKDTDMFPGGEGFKQLHTSFSDTQYYQEVLRECGYFRDYLQKNPAK